MPQALTQQTTERYLRALALRDAGHTFRTIAEQCGYADAGTARYAWIGGLRLTGRTHEIPQRTSRTVRIHTGRTTHTVTINELEGFSTPYNYTFGVELECVGINENGAERAMRTSGYECSNTGYTHRTLPTWKVVNDGSLTSRSGGSCEVVSPVLSGADGMNELRSVAKVLRDAGATTNSSCGMHIHIGVDGALTQQQQANLIVAHQRWNAAFDALVLERRVNNQYAQKRSLAQANTLAAEWMNPSTTPRDVSTYSGRYYTLNVASFVKYGTFEFRMHHGSLNGMNATAWVALHQAFIEAIKDNAAWTTGSIIDSLTSIYWTGNTQQLTDNGRAVDRASQVEACQRMLELLMQGGYLEAECGNYLTARAGRIPRLTNNQ